MHKFTFYTAKTSFSEKKIKMQKYFRKNFKMK